MAIVDESDELGFLFSFFPFKMENLDRGLQFCVRTRGDNISPGHELSDPATKMNIK